MPRRPVQTRTLTLREALPQNGCPCRILSALPMAGRIFDRSVIIEVSLVAARIKQCDPAHQRPQMPRRCGMLAKEYPPA